MQLRPSHHLEIGPYSSTPAISANPIGSVQVPTSFHLCMCCSIRNRCSSTESPAFATSPKLSAISILPFRRDPYCILFMDASQELFDSLIVPARGFASPCGAAVHAMPYWPLSCRPFKPLQSIRIGVMRLSPLPARAGSILFSPSNVTMAGSCLRSVRGEGVDDQVDPSTTFGTMT